MDEPAQPWGVQLRDPQALKALAHPARLRMLDVLHQTGGATATECAEAVGLSPSACSWHLRLLARAGLVEDAGPGRDGRQRRWKSTIPAWRVDRAEIDASPQDSAALDLAISRAMLAASDQAVELWTSSATMGHEPPAWQDAALLSNTTLRLTAIELAGLAEQIRALCAPYTLQSRPDPTARTRAVHVGLRLVPVSPPATSPDASAGAAVSSDS